MPASIPLSVSITVSVSIDLYDRLRWAAIDEETTLQSVVVQRLDSATRDVCVPDDLKGKLINVSRRARKSDFV